MRCGMVFLSFVILLWIAVIWSIKSGSVDTSVKGILDIVFRRDDSNVVAYNVIWKIRLPRIMLSILLGGFGQQLISLAERYLPGLRGLFSFLLNFCFLLVIAALSVFFTAIYVRGSGRRLPVREVLPGALFAAVGWSFFTWAISAWVSANRFGTYGSLATVVVVMLWMYYCQYALLLGACLNRAIPHSRRYWSGRREGSS